jgi:regulator of sirC expression with transglutaminase-like and TPR domain
MVDSSPDLDPEDVKNQIRSAVERIRKKLTEPLQTEQERSGQKDETIPGRNL